MSMLVMRGVGREWVGRVGVVVEMGGGGGRGEIGGADLGGL